MNWAHIRFFCLGLLVAVFGVGVAVAEAASSATIIMYHRFGQATHPSTNITLEQFERHIQELKTGGYTVLPVDQIVDHLVNGKDLPDRTVGITIDDAYTSTYTLAWPRLRAAGLPFTIFVASDALDRDAPNSINWDQLREMRDSGVGIGHHTASHLYMSTAAPEQVKEEIRRANARFQEELGTVPTLFAYPYGEASLQTMETIREAGFRAAFGQHSGVMDATGNMYYLPRFSMNEKYGDLSRLRLAANALPLPVSDVTPLDPLIGADNPPAIGFTVAPEIHDLASLSCFLSHGGQVQVERLGQRIEVRTDKAFASGRTRLNCTLLSNDEGRWLWFGRQFVKP